jgi:heparinase II/III-like protein
MLTRLRTFASLYRELGPRWTLFRLAYAFRLRTGLIRLRMPRGEWSDYKNHISNKPACFVGARSSRPILQIPNELPPNIPWNKQTAIDEANRLLNGEIKYFAHEFVKTDFPPNWHKDYFSSHVTLSFSEESLPPSSETLRSQRTSPSHRPDVLRESDMDKHWSQISDGSSTDIKFIWEPNRFTFTYTLARAYVASHNEKYPEAFWTLIEDWAQHNPPNTGTNWMDGQEIALRLMAWTFGYYAFLNSPSTTSERKENFTLYVAAQAERIHKNIDYAISTKSNHTISEAFGLWLVGLLLPELQDSEKYFSLGRKLLEQEAAAQIFPDGSYSMYSLNYHRFILHIYLCAIRLGEINDMSLRGERSSTKQSPTRFSDDVYSAVTKSIEYLSQLIDPQTGQMPVYGSNDGALVLPLNNCDFTDYRPLLQLGWYITKKEFLFEPGPWDEDIFWLCDIDSLSRRERVSEGWVREKSQPSFPNGGVYLLHNTNSHTLIRCTDFTSRPSHADQLHVDLWMHGHNLAVDAGTYLYSGQSPWRNGLASTSVHNTVIVDHRDQMTMVSRFTWTNWSRGKVLKHEKNLWQGEHDGYKHVSHKRTVMTLEGDRWLVVDNLIAYEPRHYALHWLLNDAPYEQKDNSVLLSLDGMKYKVQVGMIDGNGNFSLVSASLNSTRGWRSRYYGHKESAISLMLEATQPQVIFWSFFGLENDVVEIMGNELKINSKAIQL